MTPLMSSWIECALSANFLSNFSSRVAGVQGSSLYATWDQNNKQNNVKLQKKEKDLILKIMNRLNEKPNKPRTRHKLQMVSLEIVNFAQGGWIMLRNFSDVYACFRPRAVI